MHFYNAIDIYFCNEIDRANCNFKSLYKGMITLLHIYVYSGWIINTLHTYTYIRNTAQFSSLVHMCDNYTIHQVFHNTHYMLVCL